MSVLMPGVVAGVELGELLSVAPARLSLPTSSRFIASPVSTVSSLPDVGMASVRLTVASATRPRYQPQPLVASTARASRPATTRPVQVSRRPPAADVAVAVTGARPGGGGRPGGRGGAGAGGSARASRSSVRVMRSSRRGADVGLLPGGQSSQRRDRRRLYDRSAVGRRSDAAHREFSHRAAHVAHPTREAPTRAHPRHRRRRVHRLALRPARCCAGAYPALAGAEVDGAGQAHLRRQPGQPRAGRRLRRLRVRPGRHLRRRRWSRDADRPGTTRSCTSPPSRTSTARSTARADFVLTNVRRHPDAARRRAASTASTEFVHVSTDEVYGSIDDGLLGRGPAAASPTRRTPRPRPARDLLARAYHRTHGLPVCDHPLLQQLRALPVPGEGHPAVRHQPARRRDGAAVRRRAATSATGCTSTTTAAASSWCSSGGRAGEVYNIGGGTELTNTRAHRAAARGHAARDWDAASSTSSDRKGHDRRYSVDIAKISTELGYAPAGAVRARASPTTVAVVPRQPRLVGAAQGSAPRSRS